MSGFVPRFMYGLCMYDCDPCFMGMLLISDSRFHGMDNGIVCYIMCFNCAKGPLSRYAHSHNGTDS